MTKLFQFLAERLGGGAKTAAETGPTEARHAWDPEGRYNDKLISADSAVQLIPPGSHVFVGTACATPRTLVGALEHIPNKAPDLELVHFFTDGMVPHDDAGKSSSRYRHRCFFVGADIRAAVRDGLAEYLPISIARVPELIAVGRIPVDVGVSNPGTDPLVSFSREAMDAGAAGACVDLGGDVRVGGLTVGGGAKGVGIAVNETLVLCVVALFAVNWTLFGLFTVNKGRGALTEASSRARWARM